MPIMKNRHIYIAIFLWMASAHPSHATVIEIDEQGNPQTHEVMDFRYLQTTDTANNADSIVAPDNHSSSNTSPALPKRSTHRNLRPLYEALIAAYSVRHQAPEDLIHAVVTVESGFNKKAISPKGASGLMQLMPDTAKRFNVTNRHDAAQNINGGIAYLTWLLNRFNGDEKLALAAYNAGEGAVDKYDGIPPYPETIQYIEKVQHRLNRKLRNK
jgi:soluble lytic murein transglycosylase-like protein